MKLSAFEELCFYSLSHGHPDFVHQHVVDAFAAQDASAEDKPIRLVFALVGLYLHVERGFTGREVQLAHMKLARSKQKLPTFQIPTNCGPIYAATVLASSDEEKDSMIHDWCCAVWGAYRDQRETVEQFLGENGNTDARSVKR